MKLYDPKSGRFASKLMINTVHGKRRLVRRAGAQGWYALTAPTAAAPDGEWWVHNPQRGWVPTSIATSRALRAVLAAEAVAR